MKQRQFIAMSMESVQGLRMFLCTVLDLIVQGKSETCTNMENMLSGGIASKMYESYASYFDQNGFNRDSIPQIDEYYRKWSGIADSQEMRKYGCKANDGLALIIKLTLNEII